MVSDKGLQSKILEISQHIEGLKQSLDDPENVTKALVSALEELEVSLEELSAADEEIIQQNEELIVAQEALQESEIKYRTVADNTYDWELWLDPDGKFLYCSPSCERITGHYADEFLADPKLLHAILHPDDVTLFENHFCEVVRDAVPKHEMELRIVRPDGSIRWIGHTCQPVFDGEGRFLGARGSNRDITERKVAEEALQESEQRFRDAIENFPNVFVIYGPDRRIQFVNSIGLQITDLTEQDAIGRTDEEIFPPELIDSYLPALKRAIATKMPQAIERTRPARMGGQVIVANVIPLLDEHGNIRRVLGITYDITECKRMEDELKEARDYLELKVSERTEELSRANKELEALYKQIQRHSAELEHTVVERTKWLEAANKELESFSYSVSHDLRAPLRAMDGFSRILLEEYSAEVPPEAKRYLQLVRSSAQQMGRLIDDLLAFSRLGRQTLSKQCIMPIDLVNTVLEELRDELVDRRVDIIIGDLPACEADPILLKQVFVNLISNALKFTRNREDARIEIGSHLGEGIVVYFINDNGAGFDMQYVHKLFGVFQRLHSAEEYEGTGVGLANVQRIVHRHGGRIWAEGAVDKGATFYFTLEGGVLK